MEDVMVLQNDSAVYSNGTIVVEEPRKKLSLFGKIRDFYQKKYVDTGKSSSFEDYMYGTSKLANPLISIAAMGASLLMFFECPDSKQLMALIPVAKEILKSEVLIITKMLINKKRQLEDDFFGTHGESEFVGDTNVTPVDFFNGLMNLIPKIRDASTEIEEEEKKKREEEKKKKASEKNKTENKPEENKTENKPEENKTENIPEENKPTQLEGEPVVESKPVVEQQKGVIFDREVFENAPLQEMLGETSEQVVSENSVIGGKIR